MIGTSPYPAGSIDHIVAPAVTVRGNDIDTDRIIPARFLTDITFDELGRHAFAGDREEFRQAGSPHPFDDPRFAEAGILLVNKNFGCGSSREHAPQALLRHGRGIRAIIGESFAEIFIGNCAAIGIPCLTVSEENIGEMMAINLSHPDQTFALDLSEVRVSFGRDFTAPAWMPNGSRRAFLDGTWDSTAMLVAAQDRILDMTNLPYLGHWR